MKGHRPGPHAWVLLGVGLLTLLVLPVAMDNWNRQGVISIELDQSPPGKVHMGPGDPLESFVHQAPRLDYVSNLTDYFLCNFSYFSSSSLLEVMSVCLPILLRFFLRIHKEPNGSSRGQPHVIKVISVTSWVPEEFQSSLNGQNIVDILIQGLSGP